MKRLTPEELPRLRSIGHQFTADAKLPNQFNEFHFENVWRSLITHGLGTVFYEEDANGKILGALGGVFNQDMFSGCLVAAETFWYVLPEARGQHLSRLLLDAFESEAKTRGCKQILMVSLAALEVGTIYCRLGYTILETVHIKEI